MSFTFKCPKCGAELEAQDEWEGMETQCPTCLAAIKIAKKVQINPCKPAAPQPKDIPQAQALRGEKFPFVCPACGTFAELNTGLLGKQYTCPACCETVTANEAKEKDCPFCGEKIKFNASVCRYCQRSLPPIGAMMNRQPQYNRQYNGMAMQNGQYPYNNGMNMGSGMPKSRMTYILFGVFLGNLGIHDFYAGYTNKGIIKIAITVLGIFILFLGPLASWVWAIVDVCTVKADANGTPFVE